MYEYQDVLRNGLVLICLVYISFIFLKKSQSNKTNWAIFYASLWLTVSLAIVNYFCVKIGFWNFENNNEILKMPLDLYFVWIVFWAIIPVYLFKGKYTIAIFLFLFWFDLVFMLELEKFDVLKLNKNWLIGELLLLLFVWLPAYLWAKISFNKSHLKFRALFQVLIMALFFIILLPQILIGYLNYDLTFSKSIMYYLQIGFIIVFPALIAVQDLIIKGNGTPFPFDKTTNLVETGVYAYCRNPIQWSFTLLFIPLSIYYQTYYLLFGSVASVFYTIGISNPQEYSDMENRFGKQWNAYKKNIPNWRFLWKPKYIPQGEIFFQKDCNQCEQLKAWFDKKNSCNLKTNFSINFKKTTLLQVTYVDSNGLEFKSIKALSYALEHINLAWACLGWFMRFPVIYNILQAIVDTLEIKEPINCKNEI